MADKKEIKTEKRKLPKGGSGLKGTDRFKRTIQEYLDNLAKDNPLFAKTLGKKNKNIDECIVFILTQVQKSGRNGFTDAEIYKMAIHYYDEDDIKMKDAKDNFERMGIVVNHVNLTEQEKVEAKEKAIRELITETKKDLRGRGTKPKAEEKKEEKGNLGEQASMF